VSKPLSFGMSVSGAGSDRNAGGDRGRACLQHLQPGEE
jgi:hypothetical protein